jgi:hypothetical protein
MRCRFLPLCLLAIALPVVASAQINPFRGGRGTPLNSEDLKGLQDATRQLLDSQQVSIGSTESWNNTTSGIGGRSPPAARCNAMGSDADAPATR